MININHIVRGTFQNASLGYYVGEPYQGHGYMQQGLEQLLRLAFPPWVCTVWRLTSSQIMSGQKPWWKVAASTLKDQPEFCTSTVNGETTNAGLSLLTEIAYDHDRRSDSVDTLLSPFWQAALSRGRSASQLCGANPTRAVSGWPQCRDDRAGSTLRCH